MSAIVAAGCLMTLVSCGPIVIPKTLTEEEKIEAQAAAARRADVESVASMLIGSFTSEAQAAESKDHIDVRIESVRVWEDRQDGIWIYFEQAAASTLTNPYRQRIYRLFVQPNGIVVVEVYELPGEPLRFAGAWRRMELLKDVSPKSLILKDGCQLALQKASEEALGFVVDADLAKESSRLQSLQIRQQLGTQTLGIANQNPQSLLGLFR
jgi:hypothetical protein